MAPGDLVLGGPLCSPHCLAPCCSHCTSELRLMPSCPGVRDRSNRIKYTRDELLDLGRGPGLGSLPVGVNMSVIR